MSVQTMSSSGSVTVEGSVRVVANGTFRLERSYRGKLRLIKEGTATSCVEEFTAKAGSVVKLTVPNGANATAVVFDGANF